MDTCVSRIGMISFVLKGLGTKRAPSKTKTRLDAQITPRLDLVTITVRGTPLYFRTPKLPLETATYITDLVTSNPAHTDGLSQADSHMRLMKSVMKATFPNFTSAPLVSSQAQIDTAVAATTGSATVPIGGTLLWWSSSLPTGYTWANGAAISRSGFPALFALLGTTFGAGNGTTTFNVPNLQESIPVGLSLMGGGTSPGRLASVATGFKQVLGAVFGADTSTLVAGNLPSFSGTGTAATGFSIQAAQNPATNIPSYSGNVNGTTIPVNWNYVGTSTPFNNLPPVTVCSFIIRAL